jgi:hypothetical protein
VASGSQFQIDSKSARRSNSNSTNLYGWASLHILINLVAATSIYQTGTEITVLP